MYYVYVLRSKRSGKHYIGYTSNLENRIKQHNSGKGLYSRKHCPYVLVYSEEYSARNVAVKREKLLKSYKGGWGLINLIRGGSSVAECLSRQGGIAGSNPVRRSIESKKVVQ